tara:strand:+ start:654 stop:1313 length:660 start_codon:yes stop_codon:yes gene_type:complete
MLAIREKSVERRGDDSGYYGRLYEAKRGVVENNLSGPDISDSEVPVELKSKKPGSKSKMTLFSREPTYDTHSEIRKSKQFLDKYKNESGKLNTTIKFGSPNNRGFFLDVSDDQRFLFLCNSFESLPLARWNLDDVCQKAGEKLVNMDVADFIDEDTYTETKYRGFEVDAFRALLLSASVVVDVRMRDSELSGKKAKNRGTAFRIQPNQLGMLYKNTENE